MTRIISQFRLVCFLVLCLTVFQIASVDAYAQSASIRISIDGKPLVCASNPVSINGYTLVPMRDIVEAIGGSVEWDEATNTISVYRGYSIPIEFKINNKFATIGNIVLPLDAPAKIVNGRTMIPVRVIAEFFGADISWKSSDRLIQISTHMNDPLVFNNIGLDKLVRDSIDKPNGVITVKDIWNLSDLDINVDQYPDLASLDDISILSKFRNLQSLSISGTKVSDISPLSTLLSLNVLYLSHNQISDANALSTLKNLTRLYIDDNMIKDVNFVSELKSLTSFSASENPVYDFSPAKKVMHDYEAYQSLATKAKEIVSQYINNDMTTENKLKAIHDYIILNGQYDDVNYKNKSVPPVSYSAYGILINGVGVCDAYSKAMSLLASYCGIDCERVVGKARNEDHAWNRVLIGGEWLYIDATWDESDSPDKPIKYTYFLVTEDFLRANNHTW